MPPRKPFVSFVAFCAFACLIVATASAQYRTTYGPYYQQPYYQQPYYQPAPVNRLDRKVDGHTNYNIGRSAEPPTAESEKLFFTLITSDSYQSNDRERKLVSWMNYDPRLAKLRGSTRFNWYTASNPLYRDRIRYKLGESLPIVAIQRPDGEVLLNVTALSMPVSSGELADMCDDAVNARYAAPAVPGHASYQGQMSYQGQATSDCPNCDPPGPAPPNNDDGQVDPIPEVIPQKPFDHRAAYAVIGIFVFAGFIVLVVLACFGVTRTTSSANKIFP
jgi:hypothetical protein